MENHLKTIKPKQHTKAMILVVNMYLMAVEDGQE